jgi:general secretion pathway protein F
MLSSLLYPIVLVSVGLVSIAIVLALVIPKISQMFAESGQTLPWFTQMVIATGGIVQNYWWVMVVVAGGLYVFIRQQYAHPQSRLRWDARLLRLPVIGALIARLEAARFTRTLGALLGEDIPLFDAVTIAREVIVNQAVAEGMDQVVERVRQGEGLARPLTEVRVFPPLAGHLIQVGEESGNLDAMLLQLAQIYDHDLQSALRRVTAVLEPALILGLAVIVAGIMLSIVIAILDVNKLAL